MEKLKKCAKCKKDKSLSEYNKNTAKKDGHGVYCKSCNINYKKKHYKKNKIDYLNKKKLRRQEIKLFIDNIKNNSKCCCCTESDIACLDFHHIDDTTKEFDIGIAVRHGYSIERIQKEIDKCIIWCSNCHRKHHYYKKLKVAFD